MPNPSKIITVGIIGCGRVAEERHCPALSFINNVKIIAAADSDSQRLQKLADQYSISRRYTDYRDLIQDPEVDIVAVLTPTATHVEIGLAVMEANKHLFLEKPLALKQEEGNQLIAKSQNTTAKSILCFNLRLHHHIQAARSIIQSGQLGKIIAIRSEYTHYRDGNKAPDWHRILDKGGGVTFNESVHHIDLWRYLLSKEITEVFAFNNADEFYQDSASMLCARFQDDTLASTYNSFKTSPNCEIEIIGEKGRLNVNLYRFDGLDFVPCNQYPGHIPSRLKKIPSTFSQFIRTLKNNRHGGSFQATFYHIWRHFIDCILNGSAPITTLEDGLHSLQVSQAAIDSFTSNKMVHLNK